MPFKNFRTPRTYAAIKPMVQRYYENMRLLSTTLGKYPAEPQIDVNAEPLGFYITATDIQRITSTIGALDNFSKYLILFAIDEKDNMTACIVGADSTGQILDAHKIGNSPGEETWPKSVASLSDMPADFRLFMGI